MMLYRVHLDMIVAVVITWYFILHLRSLRLFCRPTAFCSTCWSRGKSERSSYGKQRICRSNSGSAHFYVSWLSDFIFYPKPLYKSLHQLFFYSFITILPSESGVTLDYSTIFPQTLLFRHRKENPKATKRGNVPTHSWSSKSAVSLWRAF